MILRKIYKETILEKLGLSKKFSRKVSCIKKNVLEIRLVILIIVVEIRVLKLCIVHKKAKIRISKVIWINEKLLFIEYKLNSDTIKVKETKRY